jgi:hypothetical protein
VDYLWFQDLQPSKAQQNCTKKALCDPITKLHIDENGRLVPAPDRWPSTVGANGKSLGFAPIAEKVHQLGMKFGIHVMRGISTAAVTAKSPILGGGGATAADIGIESELCPWWKGVMAVDVTKPAGQAYYDSIYQQYADWGVDFVKVGQIVFHRVFSIAVAVPLLCVHLSRVSCISISLRTIVFLAISSCLTKLRLKAKVSKS